MLIVIIKKGFRREMNYYCRLARVVSNDSFKDKISFLKENKDSSPGAKIRAEYFLKYLSDRSNLTT